MLPTTENHAAPIFQTFGRYDHFTMFVLNKGPAIVVLLVGLWVCFQQRFRRPRVSLLMGCAIFAELLIYNLGFFQFNILGRLSTTQNLTRIGITSVSGTQLLLTVSQLERVLSNISIAVIWAIAIWAALRVDDQAAKPEQP